MNDPQPQKKRRVLTLAEVFLRDAPAGGPYSENYFEAHPTGDASPKYALNYDIATDMVVIASMRGPAHDRRAIETPRSNVVWWRVAQPLAAVEDKSTGEPAEA